MQARASVLVAVPAERAFDFVADSANDPKWRSYVIASRGRATAVGDTVHQTYSAQGKTQQIELEVSEFERPSHLGYVIRQPARIRAAFQFRLEDEGTRVAMTLSSVLSGPAALFEGRIQTEAERILRTDLQRLKAALEGG